MLDKLEKIQENAQEQISSCQSEEDLQLLKAHIMGRKGSLTALLKEVPTLPIELRPEAGKRANEIKNHLAGLIEKRQEELLTLASAVPQYTDLTLPGIRPPQGGLHPITQMCYDLNDAFRSLGFEIFSEDEIKFQSLWKTFFKSVAIKERTNPRLQMQFMPKKYWKDLTEVS